MIVLLATTALMAAPLGPEDAARAEAIAEGLRCVVCQNQSVADSDAQLAKDLRALVETRVAAGDTDQEVRDHVAARYGDYVLLRPRASAQNAALWAAPLIALVIGAGGAAAYVRSRQAPQTPAPLTDEEREELNALRRQGNAR